MRGYRVELSEIEKTLESHCHVTNCKAIFSPETQQIHVFCKMDSDDFGDSEDLRNHCKKYLEAHKVPSTFTEIQEFPLTGNSKIDKQKLMEMVKSELKLGKSIVGGVHFQMRKINQYAWKSQKKQ